MSEFRYKAFISYSHEDESWARWIQRALETYRVPRHLLEPTGRPGGSNRLGHVFRDREDLSSSSSLTDSLSEALAASEFLIVICSADSAKSRWVNEEVERFQAMGRADAVLCMVVGGDPAQRSGPASCFPPALFDGHEDAVADPLAADPRDFADGKLLAKQKLIAGLLGVPLDKLRQRDLKRRRRWQVAYGVAAAGILALGALLFSARLAERAEREKAEQLASFVVDLGADLKTELDLESLGRINQMAMRYLGDLDWKNLTPETAIKVGLALRQLGMVSLAQGKYEQSLPAFQESRDMFGHLHQQHPNHGEILFELSQAEFYVGNDYFERGELAPVYEPWGRYLEIAEAEHKRQPDDPTWLLEYSYASSNLLYLEIMNDRITEALLADIETSVQLAERTMSAWPLDADVVSHYANHLAFAADAQLNACNLDEAVRYRNKSLDLASQATAADPSNKDLKLGLAYALSGLSGVLYDQGRLQDSEQQRSESLEILQELWSMDPSSVKLAWDVGYGRLKLAALFRETERLAAAGNLLSQAAEAVQLPEPRTKASVAELDEFAEFLSDMAVWQSISGDQEAALASVEELLDVFALRFEEGDDSLFAKEMVSRTRAIRWEIDRVDLAELYPDFRSMAVPADGAFRTCLHADLSARLALMEGKIEEALVQAEFLQTKQYGNPEYLRFCRKFELCQP